MARIVRSPRAKGSAIDDFDLELVDLSPIEIEVDGKLYTAKPLRVEYRKTKDISDRDATLDAHVIAAVKANLDLRSKNAVKGKVKG